MANRVAVAYLVLSIPFLLLLRSSITAMLLTITPLFTYTIALLLVRRGLHQLGRLLIANLYPFNIYVTWSLVYINAGDSAIAAKVLMLGCIVAPLVIFGFTEFYQIICSVLFICLLLLTIDFAIVQAPFKLINHDINTSATQVLCFAESIIILVIFLSYYKYSNYRAASQIRKLLIDITAQNEQIKHANAELVQSERILRDLNESKNKLFSIIAHDLRAPLNSFKGFSGLLSNNINDLSKEDVSRLVKGMFKSFNNVNDLLENLLTWSRSQMNMITQHAEQVDLDILIAENINLQERPAQEKNITLTKNSIPNLFAMVDQNIFNIVLRNLLTNAIKFTYRQGIIEVKAYRVDKFIRIEIIDNGMGMNKKTVKKLFKLDSKNTTLGTNNERGTGLGLILAKEFIEKSGGIIGAESEEGKGSMFFFTVPALQQELFNT